MWLIPTLYIHPICCPCFLASICLCFLVSLNGQNEVTYAWKIDLKWACLSLVGRPPLLCYLSSLLLVFLSIQLPRARKAIHTQCNPFFVTIIVSVFMAAFSRWWCSKGKGRQIQQNLIFTTNDSTLLLGPIYGRSQHVALNWWRVKANTLKHSIYNLSWAFSPFMAAVDKWPKVKYTRP